jgi:hypothetical protein
MTTGIVIKGRRTTFAVGTSTGTAIAITSISNATEALVTTTAAHGLTDQAVVLFAGVGGMTELNGLILLQDHQIQHLERAHVHHWWNRRALRVY